MKTGDLRRKESDPKKVLDRKTVSGYLAVTSVVRPDCLGPHWARKSRYEPRR